MCGGEREDGLGEYSETMRFKQGREPVVEAEKEGSDRLSESTRVATAV